MTWQSNILTLGIGLYPQLKEASLVALHKYDLPNILNRSRWCSKLSEHIKLNSQKATLRPALF